MEITKKFRVEAGHIVSATFSDRCRRSHHGHSYLIEVTFNSTDLDHAGMVMDFGIMKGPIREIIDSFDHCYMINRYNEKEKEYFTQNNHRWIMMPFNSSAEMMSLAIMRLVMRLLDQIELNNGEKNIKVSKVTVHETTTGRATCDFYDMLHIWRDEWDSLIEFSDGVKEDWSDELKMMMENKGYRMVIPMPEQNVITPYFNDKK